MKLLSPFVVAVATDALLTLIAWKGRNIMRKNWDVLVAVVVGAVVGVVAGMLLLALIGPLQGTL